MSSLESIRRELALLAEANLLRKPRPRRSGEPVVLCSNDYLGFGADPLPPFRGSSGAGASALVVGHWAVHEEAQAALATWLGFEGCLLFSSGFAANVGVLGGLSGREDSDFSDQLNHASIVDGCRLSRAEVVVYPHLDVEFVRDQLKKRVAASATGVARSPRRILIVTESYFSMDADSPDLAALRAIADEFGALLVVDEAHALGVFGPGGAGLCREANVQPDVLVGTLGKAFGLQGAFALASTELHALLWNRARPFVFSTALAPVLAAAIPRRLGEVRAADDRREAVLAMGTELRRRLARSGAPVLGRGLVLPWVVGPAERALALQSALEERGVWGGAIRPPTVPPGTARVRLTASWNTRGEAGSVGDVLEVVAAAVRASHPNEAPPLSRAR